MEPDSDTGLDMMTELSEDDDDGGRSVSMADAMVVAFFIFLIRFMGGD
jgi:hypothetical protein